MTDPATKAGRALLDWFGGPMRDRGGLVRHILAIEAEALADAARRVEQMEHDYAWDPAISDPDTWTEEHMAVAAAVVGGVLAILTEPVKRKE